MWSGWPDRGARPGGGRKTHFLKVVKMDAISLIKILMETLFLTSAWSGVHDGEAGGVRGEPGGVAKTIKRF